MIHIGAVAIVKDKKGRILLGRKRKGKTWVLPGGHIRQFEYITEAALRETYEETGIIAHLLPLRNGETISDVLEVIDQDKRGHHILFYVMARRKEGTLQPGSDLVQVKWFKLKKLQQLDIQSGSRKCLVREGFLK